MRDISREAGFTTSVLAHHFPDKQALIVGAFRSASEDYEAYVDAMLKRADSTEELLERLVAVSIPDDPARQAEWRLWSEMWNVRGPRPRLRRSTRPNGLPLGESHRRRLHAST